MLLIGASNSETYNRWLLLPVLGPIFGMTGRPCHGDVCIDKAMIIMGLFFDFLGQATGAALLGAGQSTKTVLVRNDVVMGAKVQWTALPTSFGGPSAGIALTGALL